MSSSLPPDASIDARLRTTPPVLEPARHTLTSLGGVRAAGVAAGIKASGSPDVALAVFDAPAACAGVFTQNKLAAAPVIVCREHLERSRGLVHALVVNSGNANACTGDVGIANAREMAAAVATFVGCPVEQVLVASTGVIGQALPMEKVRRGIAEAADALSHDVEAGRRFLRAIMTTDAFPKEAAVRTEGESPVTIAGICKGAGMIHPNMATMLAFIATNAELTPDELKGAMPRIAAESFNAVHVDTHPSTNDTFLLLATGTVRRSRGPAGPIFDAVRAVAHRLAWLIARDGEGATKVTTLRVRGARTNAAARAVADLVASSALVRTALFGNDPNWGRFVSQVGNCPDVQSVEGLRCILQGITVFERGGATPFDREAAAASMRREDVELVFELTEGTGEASLMTSDLGYKYIEINAEYTT